MIEIEHAIIGHSRPLIEIEDLTLNSGKVYAVIGRNGVGKSTFLNSILGYVPLMSGKILLNGKNIQTLKRNELSNNVAFVASKFEGVEYLRVREYVSLGKFANSSFFGKLNPEDTNHVDLLMQELSILHLADKFTDKISDGERQLAAVARALAQDTPVLLLDEPTAFLDYSNKKRMIEKLVRIATEKNKCILLSTHELDLAMDNSLPFLAAHGGILEVLPSLRKENISDYFQ